MGGWGCEFRSGNEGVYLGVVTPSFPPTLYLPLLSFFSCFPSSLFINPFLPLFSPSFPLSVPLSLVIFSSSCFLSSILTFVLACLHFLPTCTMPLLNNDLCVSSSSLTIVESAAYSTFPIFHILFVHVIPSSYNVSSFLFFTPFNFNLSFAS